MDPDLLRNCGDDLPGLVVIGDCDPARRLARELGCSRIDSRGDLCAAHRWWLSWRADQLELGATHAGAPGTGLSVDFVGGALGHRLRAGPGARDPLARALGRPRDDVDDRPLLDATAGLGRDALLAAQAGHRVLAVERSPILVALVRDGLRRAADDARLADLAARVELRCADARELLGNDAVDPAVVYLDPMFPAHDKSARVKKPMQLLQALLQADDETGTARDSADRELLAAALSRPGRRVVVKRPARAEPLGGLRPLSAVGRGRTTRYDIYGS